MHRLEKLYLTMALQKTEHGAAFDKNAASKSCLSCVLHKRNSTCLFELRFCQGLLSEEGMRLQGEPGSTSGILWSKDDAYARVFGPECPGGVRGVGFGITPSGRSVTNASKFTSTPSSSTRTSQRILELENNNALIREQLAQVQEQLAQSDARHQEQQQQTEVRHQQQLDAALVRMNAMFAQLSSGTPFFDLSQVPNKC